LEVSDTKAVIATVRGVLPDVGFAVDSLDGFGCEPPYEVMWPIAKVKPFADLIDKPALKLLFRHPSMGGDVFSAIVEAVGPHGTIIYGSTASAPDARTHIEIMAPGVSKASALQRLCDVHNIDKDDAIAFGDMPNDIEMLAWAGHGVAMGNGHHEVKAIANEVALTNDEDGVGVILERELARR
jgi:hypothetical protein